MSEVPPIQDIDKILYSLVKFRLYPFLLRQTHYDQSLIITKP
jgi:hypothetical protein